MRDTSKDIFVRHQLDLKLTPITHFEVQNNLMLVALNAQLFHVRLQNGRQTNLKLPIEQNDRIAHLHMCPSGVHALISTVAGENFYTHMRTGALKQLRRLKNHVISAVGWNTAEFSKDGETGFIVLGTTKGHLYESNITAASSTTSPVAYLKLLSSTLAEKEMPISGLCLRQFPEDDAEHFLLMVCMPNRLYCLAGPPNLSAASPPPSTSINQMVGTVWSSALMEPAQPDREAVLKSLFAFGDNQRPRYLCMDGGAEEKPPAGLAIQPVCMSDDSDGCRFRFGWLSSSGISIGRVDTGRVRKQQLPDAYDMLDIDANNLKHRLVEGRVDYPLNILLTEYHFLRLFSSRLTALSLLDNTNAFEDIFIGVPKMVGMCRDSSSQQIWVATQSTMFTYTPNDETRHVWRHYLAKGEFAKAKKIANQLTDKRPFQMILKREAEKFLAEKNFVAAAESLAQSEEPFERLVILLLAGGTPARNGLKRFLELKLVQVPMPAHASQDRMRRDMLVLWLLDIQLAELAEMRRGVIAENGEKGGRKTTLVSCASSAIAPSPPANAQLAADMARLKEQLQCFLNRQAVFEAVQDNQQAVYRMIGSHVDLDTQLLLAQKLRDHRTVLKLLLMRGEYQELLDTLARDARSPELYYEYAPQLLRAVPHELVAALLRLQQETRAPLNALKLLPAFQLCLEKPAHEEHEHQDLQDDLQQRQTMADAVFNYLEHVPAGAPAALMDFSIRLHAVFRPKSLLALLKKCCGNDGDANTDNLPQQFPPFDVGQALSVCTENGLHECAVFLLCVEGLYEEAVRLALRHLDLRCAKECARRCDAQAATDTLVMLGGSADEAAMLSHQQEQRKRVWLEIVKSVLAAEAPIEKCLALLAESQGAVRIQDVLAYFPKFHTIEHLREPICDSLKNYSDQIKTLQREIREVTGMAAELRTETAKARSTNFMVVRASDSCTVCRAALIGVKPFVAFVCRHFFHSDCLETKVKASSGEYTRLERERRVLEKEVELATAAASVAATAVSGDSGASGGGRAQLLQAFAGKKRAAVADQQQQEQAAARKLERASKRLAETRERMHSLLHGDCPLCGPETIEAINAPFFDPEVYRDQLVQWLP